MTLTTVEQHHAITSNKSHSAYVRISHSNPLSASVNNHSTTMSQILGPHPRDATPRDNVDYSVWNCRAKGRIRTDPALISDATLCRHALLVRRLVSQQRMSRILNLS